MSFNVACATDKTCAASGAYKATPGSERPVYIPTEGLDELDGLDAYLNFARDRGLPGHSAAWKHGDIEVRALLLLSCLNLVAQYAQHLIYNRFTTHARSRNSGKTYKPLITEALMELTESKRTAPSKDLKDYTYAGLTVWTAEEKAIFRRGMSHQRVAHSTLFPQLIKSTASSSGYFKAWYCFL